MNWLAFITSESQNTEDIVCMEIHLGINRWFAPHNVTQVLWNNPLCEAAKIKSLAWRFFSIPAWKVGTMIDPSGKIVFYGVVSIWKDCWIWKRQCKIICVFIKRKSVTVESFNSYCWTQAHIHSQSLSLRECQEKWK